MNDSGALIIMSIYQWVFTLRQVLSEGMVIIHAFQTIPAVLIILEFK